MKQREFGCSKILEKEMNREEIKVTSNSLILEVIIFSWLVGGNTFQKMGGQEVFVGGRGTRTTVVDMEVQRLDGEVVSGRVASLSLDGSRWRSGGDSAFYCHTTAITRGAAHSING